MISNSKLKTNSLKGIRQKKKKKKIFLFKKNSKLTIGVKSLKLEIPKKDSSSSKK